MGRVKSRLSVRGMSTGGGVMARTYLCLIDPRSRRFQSHRAAVDLRRLVLVDRHAVVADRVGDQGKSLDFSLEHADGRRPAVIDRQAKLGPEVDDLAAGRKNREPARGRGHARRHGSVPQPGGACRNELEAGGALEDDARTQVKLDLGQTSFQPRNLPACMSRLGFCSRPAHRQSWALTSQAILPGDALSAATVPHRKGPIKTPVRGAATTAATMRAARRDPNPTPRWNSCEPPTARPGRWTGSVRSGREPVENGIGRAARSNRELNFRVVMEIVDEVRPCPFAFQQNGLESAEPFVVNQAGTIQIDQIGIFAGQIAWTCGAHASPSCARLR